MDIEKISKRIYGLQKKRVEDLGTKLTLELVFHLSKEAKQIARQLQKNLERYAHIS